jgi:hypothetical protein
MTTMSKRKVMIGAVLFVLPAAVALVTPGTASADMSPGVCNDFIGIAQYYDSIGDRATADALWANLEREGCVEFV